MNNCPPTFGSDECNQRLAIVIAAGPGKESLMDTLESVEAYCPEPHLVFIVDDQTTDGTYEALCRARKPNWRVFRNGKRHGMKRLIHTLCFAYQQVIRHSGCQLILKLDLDALLIKPGVLSDALHYVESNPRVGLFGVYEHDYNRPRTFEVHRQLFERETAWCRALIGRKPSWLPFLKLAEKNNYRKGDNVFGGAYFLTRQCVVAAARLGALNIPWFWHSRLIDEDVYFSMVAVAAGFRLGHFAAPEGPLCLEWRGLPFPAAAMASSKYKLVHSVDKGPNTGPLENDGRPARAVFRDLRAQWLCRPQATGLP